MKNITLFAAKIALGLAVSTTMATASGTHSDGHHAPEIGQVGKASEVTSVVTMRMNDNYFSPEKIEVRKGETIRFVVKNEGDMVHEFNIGTAATHAAHQEEMLAMMNSGMLEPDKINHHMMGHGDNGMMKHDDPNSILLEPGQSGEVIWQFSKGAELEFACNVPGHYESGMHGKIITVE